MPRIAAPPRHRPPGALRDPPIAPPLSQVERELASGTLATSHIRAIIWIRSETATVIGASWPASIGNRKPETGNRKHAADRQALDAVVEP